MLAVLLDPIFRVKVPALQLHLNANVKVQRNILA